MSQKSLFWTTGAGGDGASAYTQADLFGWLKHTFTADPATEAVHPDWGGGLAVSGTASPVSVATGAALVAGIPFESDAAVTFTVSTPTLGTTGHRIVLRADYSAKTVRLALLSSSNGVAAIPAVTQVANTTWEVGIASLTITTGGVITITDTRGYLHYRTRVNTAMLDDGNVTTAKLANDSVDDTKVGARVPQFIARQGGNASDWSAGGTTNYTPGAVRMQSGVITWIGASANSGLQGITLPVAFSTIGSGWATAYDNNNATAGMAYIAVGTTGATIYWRTITNTTNVTLRWFAIGPE